MAQRAIGAPVDRALAASLGRIVGERRVLLRESELVAYSSDGLPSYNRRPSLAVFPGTRDEVVAVVRELAKRRVPFVPRGAGTGLSGGALADGIVLVGLNRLTRILKIDAENQVAVVEPGVVNVALTRLQARTHSITPPIHRVRRPALSAAMLPRTPAALIA
jgi:FAD/FMN-containing dehydrogenase